GYSQERALTSPHPNYQGWSDARIQHDASRLEASGIKKVYVRMSPRDVRDERRIARLDKFAGKIPASVKVVLLLDCEGMNYAAFETFLDRFAALNLQRHPSYVTSARQPLLLIENAIALKLVSHPAVRIQSKKWSPAPMLAENSKYLAGAKRDYDADEIVLAAGKCQGTGPAFEVNWTVKRRDGKTLTVAMAAANRLSPAWIVIDSWNDFRNGSFIEPNAFDGSTVLDAVQKAITGVRAER
ncbi:MAG: hypothetical protein ACI8W8_004507, partial [Rhodothermales bacterium]